MNGACTKLENIKLQRSQQYGRVIKKTTNGIIRVLTTELKTKSELVNFSVQIITREREREKKILFQSGDESFLYLGLQPNSFFELLNFIQKYPCQLQNHPSKTYQKADR